MQTTVHEDPAITQAKQLVQEKQAKQAFNVLVRRIEELNTLNAALVGHMGNAGPAAQPEEMSGAKRAAAFGGAIVYLGISILVIGLLVLCLLSFAGAF